METDKDAQGGEREINEPMDEIVICEMCGKNVASTGIPQMDGSMYYVCDFCAEGGM